MDIFTLIVKNKKDETFVKTYMQLQNLEFDAELMQVFLLGLWYLNNACCILLVVGR